MEGSSGLKNNERVPCQPHMGKGTRVSCWKRIWSSSNCNQVKPQVGCDEVRPVHALVFSWGFVLFSSSAAVIAAASVFWLDRPAVDVNVGLSSFPVFSEVISVHERKDWFVQKRNGWSHDAAAVEPPRSYSMTTSTLSLPIAATIHDFSEIRLVRSSAYR